ncbi:hypothetical protein BMF94_2510 [Rhodotorula taiwanensis]|uniref:Cytochrome c oxidase assembly factor 3 n=1 Tax=Rhodotorula taiwanensis TaxID=741276 RepID=A0A2S5BC09_9BASI|nr:hypothetical protein BMF94_2510 [Rhodotorula taiwanensis]
MSGVSSRQARATYHPGGYGVSEGLKRARRPFRTRNFITGGLITAFAFSVYMYSIRAVAQDDFSDLAEPVSEEQRKAAKSIEDERREREAVVADRLAVRSGVPLVAETKVPVTMAAAAPGAVTPADVAATVPATTTAVAAAGHASSGGVLDLLRGSFGGRGADSKLVWGAPPVDRLGRIGQDVPAEQYQRRLV